MDKKLILSDGRTKLPTFQWLWKTSFLYSALGVLSNAKLVSKCVTFSDLKKEEKSFSAPTPLCAQWPGACGYLPPSPQNVSSSYLRSLLHNVYNVYYTLLFCIILPSYLLYNTWHNVILHNVSAVPLPYLWSRQFPPCSTQSQTIFYETRKPEDSCGTEACGMWHLIGLYGNTKMRQL